MNLFNSQNKAQSKIDDDESTNEVCATESREGISVNMNQYHFEVVLDIIQVHTGRTIF